MGETSRTITWIARIWSLASIGFVLLFVVADALDPNSPGPTRSDWIGLSLWPGGVVLGLVLGWLRTGLGGAIATGSLIGFYLWHLLERGTFPGGPYFVLVAVPGILFLLASLLSWPHERMRPA
jgi:hypothetical protein